MPDQPPFNTIGDEPVEARIVAWVLGEASAFEAAELDRLCEERPELLIFRRRMRALHGLLTEAEAAESDDAWKLPAEKRKALDELFGSEPPAMVDFYKERSIRHSARRAILSIAACLLLAAVIAGLTAPMVIRQRKKADVSSALMREELEEGEDFMPSSGIGDPAASQLKRNTTLRNESRNSTTAERVFAQSSVQKPELSPSAPLDVSSPGSTDIAGRRGEITDAERLMSPRGMIETRSTVASEAESEVRYKMDKPADRKPSAGEVAKQKKLAGGADLAGGAKYSVLTPATPSAPKPEVAASEPMADMPAIAGNASGLGSGIGGGGGGGAFKGALEELPPPPTIAPAESKATNNLTLNGVSDGLRSGDQAINRSSIDAILNNPERAAQSEQKRKLSELGKDKDASRKGGKSEAQAPPVLAAKKPSRSQPHPRVIPPVAGGAAVDPFAADNSDLTKPNESDVSRTNSGLMFRGGLRADAELGRAADVELYYSRSRDRSELDVNPTDILPGLSKQSEVPSLSDGTKRELPKEEGNLTPTDKYWDTSSAVKASGGVEYELHGGYSSEYAFRGIDLKSDERSLPLDQVPGAALSFEEKPAVPDLAELMEEMPASETPYSTFSLNISDASFQTAKAAIAKGERPDPESIKPEQFYNAVDYGDPAPAANEPVAATIEQAAHPVIPGRNLVRLALRTASTGHSAAQPLRLTLLVDQSGSMVREDRRIAMEQALAQLSGLLTKNDVISVVGFSRQPRLLADGMTGDKATKLGELVNQTASEGGTNLEEAMKIGAQMAARHQLPGAQNRIVLFTDGAANLGNANPERLAEQVKALRQKGIAFDIAGIGADGLNDRLLGELARHGNGRYYVVSDAKNTSFATQLAGAFHPAAENVKVQVNFNPQRVGKYKLIGFEKDRLKSEDFRNDSVDAAELAAEEAGVAIYQVETLPEGDGEIGEVSVRFKETSSGEMVERAWTIPHEEAATAFDRATPSMQLAGLCLLTAEELRGGSLAEAIDFKRFAAPRALVKQFYNGNTKVAEMLRMIDALQ